MMVCFIWYCDSECLFLFLFSCIVVILFVLFLVLI